MTNYRSSRKISKAAPGRTAIQQAIPIPRAVRQAVPIPRAAQQAVQLNRIGMFAWAMGSHRRAGGAFMASAMAAYFIKHRKNRNYTHKADRPWTPTFKEASRLATMYLRATEEQILAACAVHSFNHPSFLGMPGSWVERLMDSCDWDRKAKISTVCASLSVLRADMGSEITKLQHTSGGFSDMPAALAELEESAVMYGGETGAGLYKTIRDFAKSDH